MYYVYTNFDTSALFRQILQIETELLDEEIRLWSAGKETNIRLLLSALHHVRH